MALLWYGIPGEWMINPVLCVRVTNHRELSGVTRVHVIIDVRLAITENSTPNCCQ